MEGVGYSVYADRQLTWGRTVGQGARKTEKAVLQKGSESMNHLEKKEKNRFQGSSQREQLKFEIAQELGLDGKVMEQGWKSLTAKESGRIGGMMTKRVREQRKEMEAGKEDKG